MEEKMYMQTDGGEWQSLGECTITSTWNFDTKEKIVELIFNPPYTIINWSDGTLRVFLRPTKSMMNLIPNMAFNAQL